ncbi:MAG: hypothetical protein H6Q90_6796 [Deltaproteobacteria bacterium]|nr:hypothetical protein [Deltaproteobacteria bacterium]
MYDGAVHLRGSIFLAILEGCSFSPRTTVDAAPLLPDAASSLDAPDAPAPADAPVGALACPPDYASIAQLTSRYRVIAQGETHDLQRADCQDDDAGAMFRPGHLLVIDSTGERDAMITLGGTTADLVWVGLTQAPMQATPRTGWTWDDTGAPLDENIVTWVTTEPNDAGGSENNEENAAGLGVGGLSDLRASEGRHAICECEP